MRKESANGNNDHVLRQINSLLRAAKTFKFSCGACFNVFPVWEFFVEDRFYIYIMP